MPTTTDGPEGVHTAGRAAYLPAAEAVVVADLHAGRAAASNVGLLLDERAGLRDRLGRVVEATDPETVVFAGDLLHRFGDPTPRAVGTIRSLAGLVRAAGARPIAVAGNHDGGLAAAWPGPVHDAYRLGDGTVVCHGHDSPEMAGGRYVCGHLHPALTAAGRKRDCFLAGDGQVRGRPVLVLPAFSTFARGLRIERRERIDSPLVTDLDTLRPGVVDDDAGETLWFPPLGESRRHLGW
ncbi:metallophosphoesterase [Haloplanus salilacus]|uniref:metallophosphoesterase n=1 Tax=Haloplanus salilacus TaxID=2949994 RepID=UPI0030D54532